MNDEEQDDKTKELPLGKETEANLFKSRSIFIYGTGAEGVLAARGPCRSQR
jgi:hypothetical protein